MARGGFVDDRHDSGKIIIIFFVDPRSFLISRLQWTPASFFFPPTEKFQWLEDDSFIFFCLAKNLFSGAMNVRFQGVHFFF